MHEVALAQSMAEIVEETARRHNAHRVRLVRLELGALSHVAPEALRFCFDAAVRGTLADSARLEIVTTPGRAWCMPCSASVALPALGEPCPMCGSYQLGVVSGEEMRVKDIEVV
ncbi:MAG TPA: hydrogenase maturation nickel metallochaperone HypA [Casimicrobiaceae bacterium]|nr:hydrogenase maturation nickel metallochaperone HypA [Casimicrobiaceae bacterium]